MRLRPLLALLAAVTLVAGPAGASSPAGARSGTPPRTAPDAVTTYAGNFEVVRVLGNDSDVENDRLKVCALGPEKYPQIRTDVYGRKVDVTVRTKAAPGTYTFTYYACDGTAQTPGTLTLVVAEPPRIKLRPVPGRPGRVQATSDAPFKVRLTYGNFLRDDAEGIVTIPRHGSVRFSTRYHRTDWIARTVDGTQLDRGLLPYVP